VQEPIVTISRSREMISHQSDLAGAWTMGIGEQESGVAFAMNGSDSESLVIATQQIVRSTFNEFKNPQCLSMSYNYFINIVTGTPEAPPAERPASRAGAPPLAEDAASRNAAPGTRWTSRRCSTVHARTPVSRPVAQGLPAVRWPSTPSFERRTQMRSHS
jgi:hypothetical protein